MENKYYVPEISEFHIGFEYEWLHEDDEWIKENSPTEISPEGYDEQTYGIRVKYLDKEDIESLGFKQSENDKTWYDYKNERFWLYKENYKDINWTISDNESEVGFTGIIKNKSELKVLLKQLNVK